MSLENRFKHLFEYVKDGILFLDYETGKITDINPYATDMLDLNKAKCIGKSIWEIDSLKNSIPNMEKFKELNKKEFIKYSDIEIETADKRKTKVDLIGTIYHLGNKKVIQCFIHKR